MKFQEYLKDIEQDAEYAKAERELKVLLDLADEVLDLRLERGWSQSELARRAGTRQANISRVESGLANPTVKFLQKLAQAFDTELVVRLRPRQSEEHARVVYVPYMDQPALYPLQLVDVRLYEATIERYEPVEETEPQEEVKGLPVGINLKVVRHSSRRVSVFLEINVSGPKAHAPEFHLRFVLEGLFDALVDLDEIDEESWKEFEDISAITLLWPYAREYTGNFARRMRADVPVLPTLNRLSMSRLEMEEAASSDDG